MADETTGGKPAENATADASENTSGGGNERKGKPRNATQTPGGDTRQDQLRSASQNESADNAQGKQNTPRNAPKNDPQHERGNSPQTDALDAPRSRRGERRADRSGRPDETRRSSADGGRKPDDEGGGRKSDKGGSRKPADKGGIRPAGKSGRMPAGNALNAFSERRSKPSGSAGRKQADAGRHAPSAPQHGGRRWTWRDYALQFSVVILGVMVTFIGSGLIERWRTAREVRTVMQLVHEELKNNRQELASICVSLNRDRLGMELLHAHGMDYKKVPADSLEKYRYILGAMRDFKPHADALEVLRSSGTIMEIGDKQLLFDVLGCYAWMERFSTAVDNYNAQKLASLNHLFSAGLHGSLEDSDPAESWRVMMDDTMCAAFIGTMANFFGKELLEGEAVARLDGVAQAVAEKYRFE